MVAVFQKVDDFEPMVFRRSGEHGSVLLYARELEDVTRLQGFLAAADYHYQSAASIFDQSADCGFYAVIVCQRHALAEPQVPLSDWGNARVIVVADSYREDLIVSTLDAGAHYYFNLRDSDNILGERLQSALRQHVRVASQPLTLGDIHFDVQKRKVSRAGKAVDLSPKEFDFAFYLFSNRDRVVGNNELMTSVWSLPADMDTRRIDTAACRVRKKLNLFNGEGWELKRIRRLGYRLDRLPEEASNSSFADEANFDPRSALA